MFLSEANLVAPDLGRGAEEVVMGGPSRRGVRLLGTGLQGRVRHWPRTRFKAHPSLVSLDVGGFLAVRTGRTPRPLGLNANRVLCYWEL